jgi:hypothetical protein
MHPIHFPFWFTQLAIAENFAGINSCTLRLLHKPQVPSLQKELQDRRKT